MSRSGFLPGSFTAFPYVILNVAFFILVIGMLTLQAMRPGPWLVSQGVGMVGCYKGAQWASRAPGGGLTTIAGCGVGYGLGSLGMMSLIGPDGNMVTVSIDGAADIRDTGTYPLQAISMQDGGTGPPLGYRLKQHFTCEEHDDPVMSCTGVGGTPGSFVDAIEQIVPDSRKHAAEAAYRSTVIERTPAAGESYERGPAIYHSRIPMPGGEHAELVFTIEGMRGGVIWQ